jgi:DNA invertase Pin-like site-specific DNA recombinase
MTLQKILNQEIGLVKGAGRFFFHAMASLAEMERELTIERTRAGLEAARPRPKPSVTI